MADLYIGVLARMVAACDREGPALYVVTRTGLRPVLLED
jgi:hypothetical protein